MTKQTYKFNFAGSTYHMGQLDAEQIAALRMLIQLVTFQPDQPITEENRWIKIDGTAGPVLLLDRQQIFNR